MIFKIYKLEEEEEEHERDLEEQAVPQKQDVRAISIKFTPPSNRIYQTLKHSRSKQLTEKLSPSLLIIKKTSKTQSNKPSIY